MDKIISSESMRLCEAANIAAKLADPLELMYIAGKNCTEIFLEDFYKAGKFRRVVIFAGHGNNGGDGVVMASLLAELLPLEVVLALALPPEKLSDSSKYYFARLNGKVQLAAAADVVLNKYDLVIDALLGTGCSKNMREPYKSLIESINQSCCPVFSVDLPSGLGSDTAVRADMTASIGYFKDILFSADGIEHSGLLRLAELPLVLEPESADNIEAAHAGWFRNTALPIPRNVHKYQRGNVLIIGGSVEYFQAPFLSARSALRAGAGLVRLAVPFAVLPGSGTLSVIPVSVPAANGVFSKDSLAYIEKYLPKTDCIAVGPGLGRNPDTAAFIAGLLAINKPLIMDADALFFAAQQPELCCARTAVTILTPHAGEAQTLAKGVNKTLTEDNTAAARMLAKAYNAVVLLKGARTAVALPDGRVRLNTSGTPALATAGSGDVLTGIIAAELAAYHNAITFDTAYIAASRGAFLHGMAGEKAQEKFGSKGVIADDLPELAAVCNVQ